MSKELFFSAFQNSYSGQLSPDLVGLFYYDICFDAESDYHHLYEWTREIESYLRDNNIIIEAKKEDEIPASVKENEVYFVMLSKDNDNKAAALFRHLRNAFSHFSVGVSGNNICLKDHNPINNKLTMIGIINKDVFLCIMHFFHDQKSKNEEMYNEYLS